MVPRCVAGAGGRFRSGHRALYLFLDRGCPDRTTTRSRARLRLPLLSVSVRVRRDQRKDRQPGGESGAAGRGPDRRGRRPRDRESGRTGKNLEASCARGYHSCDRSSPGRVRAPGSDRRFSPQRGPGCESWQQLAGSRALVPAEFDASGFRSGGTGNSVLTAARPERLAAGLLFRRRHCGTGLSGRLQERAGAAASLGGSVQGIFLGHARALVLLPVRSIPGTLAD